MPKTLHQKSKILAIHQGAMGDVILAIPGLNALKLDDKIDIVCQAKLKPLIRHFDLAHENNIYSTESQWFSSLYLDSIPHEIKLVLNQYESIFIFSVSDTLEKNLIQQIDAKVYRICPRPPIYQDIHTTSYILDQIRRLIENPNEFFFPTLNIQPSKVLIHPGSGGKRKNWPIERFIELTYRFISDRISVQWLIGPADLHLIQKNASFETHISDNISELILLITTDKLFIGNDSGVAHLAGITGCHTIVIFGVSSSKRWHPLGPCVYIIEKRPETLKCKPCFEISDSVCDNRECMTNIGVDDVYLMANDILKCKNGFI